MKTNKEYTTTNMNAVTAPAEIVRVNFKGSSYKGALGDLGDWVVTNKPSAIVSCYTNEGRHGIYPTIMATTPRLATALSVIKGYPVFVGEGVTYFTVAHRNYDVERIRKVGVSLLPGSVTFTITATPYEVTKASLPKQLPLFTRTEEQDLADSPFTTTSK